MALFMRQKTKLDTFIYLGTKPKAIKVDSNDIK